MGDTRCTIRGLRIEGIDAERNLLWIRGAVPGARGSLVIIRKQG
jgi:large subunit ribosomal protein L3